MGGTTSPLSIRYNNNLKLYYHFVCQKYYMVNKYFGLDELSLFSLLPLVQKYFRPGELSPCLLLPLVKKYSVFATYYGLCSRLRRDAPAKVVSSSLQKAACINYRARVLKHNYIGREQRLNT